MPTRDDISVEFAGKHRRDRNGNAMPAQPEQLDCAGVLDEFTNRAANLGNEISFMQDEIKEKDRLLAVCLDSIKSKDASIQKWIKINGSHEQNPKEESLRNAIRDLYDKAENYQNEKFALTEKTQELMEKHLRWLDENIKGLQERGEFPNDPDLPSVLNPQPQRQAPRAEPSAGAMPLNQIANPSVIPHQRHPNQHPLRVLPPQVQTQNLPGSVHPSSAPATPAAAHLINQQRRESSLGAGPKRQRTGGPTPSSGLVRHTSMTPGTPRGQTPTTGVRQSSIGPRASQKTTVGNKKVAPAGSRQSGAPRKKMPKSGLSRVKRTGNKNSPSSTNDSELSEADSDSAEDDDQPHTPQRGDKDGDEDMADPDDEEGTDNKKYCTCQNVSYGNMVACDNDSCPFEWFHWSCVGLKSEPVGTWICPVCKP